VRAAQVVRLAGPAGVDVVDVPEPESRPDRVVVDVHAAGVGFPDLLLSRGEYQLRPELPFTLGVDFAGVVRSAPDGGELRPGDRVAGWDRIGAAAEVVTVSATNVFPLPDTVDYTTGACLPLNYLTAYYALTVRGGLRSGETMLVTGGGGGLGTAVVQVARAFGARVLATGSTAEKRTIALQAGAHEALPATDFAAAARELTGGQGVDMVVDVVGGQELTTGALRSLAPLGRLLVVGFTSGELADVKLNRLLAEQHRRAWRGLGALHAIARRLSAYAVGRDPSVAAW